MDLSVVIVTRNSRAYLGACLGSVAGARGPERCEVILVDNASDDGTIEWVEATYPGVRVIANEANVGFARANNQGIECSTGRHVLLLNPDTEVYPDALEAMVSFLDAHPQVGVVGCRLLNPDGGLQYSWRRGAPLLVWAAARMVGAEGALARRHVRRMVWDIACAAPGEAVPVEEIMGACLMTRREVLEQVGGLDETIFMSLEDSDFCLRVARAGWQVAYLPGPAVVHHGGHAARRDIGTALAAYYRSEMRFVRKHHGSAAVVCHRLLLAAECLGKGAVTLAQFAAGRAQSRARLAVYRRTLRNALSFEG